MAEMALADPPMASIASLSGRRKAAMLCVSLGPEAAAEIMRELPQDLVELLTIEMAHARGYLSEGGVAYAREVLEKAIGAKQAEEILSRLATVIEVTPFEFL